MTRIMGKLVKRPKRRDSYAALDRRLNAALLRRDQREPAGPPAGLWAHRQAPPGRAGWLVSFDPDFSHCRISSKHGPCGEPSKKSLVLLPRRLQAPLEAYFALNTLSSAVFRITLKELPRMNALCLL